MLKSDAAQKQHIQDSDIYIETNEKTQVTWYDLNNDDAPYFQSGFCHNLKLKNFDHGCLFPGEKFTKKQSRVLQAIVANCMKMPGQEIKIAFHKSAFCTGSPAANAGYGFKPFNTVRRKMEDAGLIKTHAPISYNTDNHPTSWLKGTQRLYGVISGGALIEYKPDYVYLMKGFINGRKIRSYIPFKNPNAPRLRRIRDIMEPYHRMIETHDITCNVPKDVVGKVVHNHIKSHKDGKAPQPPDVNFKYPICIFSDDVNTGGRLYNSWWTGCKREFRQYLRIDGQQCVEMDFTAMHPQILYQLEGYPPQDNIYLYDKSTPFQRGIIKRDVVKILLLALINIDFQLSRANTRRNTVNAARKELLSKHGVETEYQAVEGLLSEVEARHFPILKHFYSGAWRACVTQEADLVRDVIKTAMMKNILVLSVHDSVICKARDKDVVEAIVRQKTTLPFDLKWFK